MEERRFFKRIPYDKLIRCNVLKEDGLHDIIKGSMNISGGGICLETEYLLDKENDLTVEINIPGYYKSIPARGEIVWNTKSKENSECNITGIRFTNIGSFERQMILDYVHFG